MASRGINKVILVGNLGNDPEVRYMPNGNAVANVSLATSDSWKDKATGEQQEKTGSFSLTALPKLLSNTSKKALSFTSRGAYRLALGNKMV